MTLHYQSYGDGPPLIILHGLFGSLGNWHTLGKKFGEQFKVYALDQRNHGQSFHSDTFNYQVMAEDLREFLDEHQLESANILGHSMGGKTAMTFAVSYSARVMRLIVADIAPKRYPPGHQEIFDALLSIDLKSFSSRNEVDNALAARIPEFGVRQFLMKNLARDDENRFYWRMNLPVIYQSYLTINDDLPAGAKFDNPTLFIRGAKSNYIRDEDLPLIKEIFPDAQLRTIENAGHWVHADAPAEFAAIVLDFLS